MHARLVEAAADDLPEAARAKYAGIGPATYRRWKLRAREGEEPYASLMREIGQAEAECVRRRLRLIEETARGEYDEEKRKWIARPNWQAAAWLLERRHPDQYGMVPAMRPDMQEEQEQTSAEARKEQILRSYRRTRKGGDA